MANPNGFTNEAGLGTQIIDNALSQVSGVLSTKPTAKYASGPRAVIKINGQLVGFAFDVSWTITTENIEVKTIDDYNAYELVPNRIMVDGSLGGFHVPGAGASAQLIQANVLSFLFHKYITLEITDSATQQLLFVSNKVVVTSRTESISAEKLGSVRLTWKAIGWEDEITPAYPLGYDGEVQADQSAATRLTQAAAQINTAVGNII